MGWKIWNHEKHGISRQVFYGIIIGFEYSFCTKHWLRNDTGANVCDTAMCDKLHNVSSYLASSANLVVTRDS